EGAQQQTTRLGEVDARRRRGVTTITEDTGPSRPERGRRPGGGGGRPGGGGGRPGGGGGGGRGQQTGPSGPSTPVGRRAPDRSARPAAEAPPAAPVEAPVDAPAPEAPAPEAPATPTEGEA